MVRQNNFKKGISPAKIIIITLFIILPIVIGIYCEIRDYNKDYDISKNTATCKGVITDIYIGRNPTISWKYKVGNQEYEGYTLDTKQFNFIQHCPDEKSCLGDSFIVEYSKVNPQNSRLIINGMKSYR